MRKRGRKKKSKTKKASRKRKSKKTEEKREKKEKKNKETVNNTVNSPAPGGQAVPVQSDGILNTGRSPHQKKLGNLSKAMMYSIAQKTILTNSQKSPRMKRGKNQLKIQ